ncbi:hypothetical protein ZOSMA_189G00020 [Zostera marina]|uniref:Uncharacterized protein n=1 Tax=Zostera marina TaxID=29655 RepID=A0A0K9PPZ3_ZOSMR|nr:hypothetical protein ZOSMA_189G00020 [Zostera marina]
MKEVVNLNGFKPRAIISIDALNDVLSFSCNLFSF